MFRIAGDANVPLMSCSTAPSASRCGDAIAQDLGKIIGCDVFGPMPEEPTQPGLFWYGVHSIEVLNVVMGRGCREVRACATTGATWWSRRGRTGAWRRSAGCAAGSGSSG